MFTPWNACYYSTGAFWLYIQLGDGPIPLEKWFPAPQGPHRAGIMPTLPGGSKIGDVILGCISLFIFGDTATELRFELPGLEMQGIL